MQHYILHPTAHSVIPISEEMLGKTELIVTVKQTTISNFYVSTVFLGIDHDLFREVYDPFIDYKPLIFETMIFAKDGESQYQARYRSYDSALAWHNTIVEHLTNGKEIETLPDPPEEEQYYEPVI